MTPVVGAATCRPFSSETPLGIPDHLLNEHYNDRYFDVINAIEEGRHIHIRGGNVIERMGACTGNGRAFRVGETGFGAGRLLIALMDAVEESGIAGTVIDYCSVELHPVTAGRMSRILADFRPRAGHIIDKLIDAYSGIDVSIPGWHHAVIAGDSGIVNLRLFIGEALGMVESLDDPRDAWFLDGHCPVKNPAMWRAELMSAIGRKTAPGGTVTTFTVAGHVRRNLASAGFSVEKAAGHGRKREALRGVFCERC